MKHGLRVRPGGFSLAFGPEDVPGVPAPPEKMSYLGGSDFGSSFFYSAGIGNEIDKRNPTHFRLKRHSLNWDPEGLSHGLNLISMSLNNILAFLKVVNGIDAESVKLIYPDNESYFEAPWRPSYSIGSSGIHFLPCHKLSNVPPQMLATDFVIRSHDGAFYHRPKRLNAVCRDISSHIFAP